MPNFILVSIRWCANPVSSTIYNSKDMDSATYNLPWVLLLLLLLLILSHIIYLHKLFFHRNTKVWILLLVHNISGWLRFVLCNSNVWYTRFNCALYVFSSWLIMKNKACWCKTIYKQLFVCFVSWTISDGSDFCIALEFCRLHILFVLSFHISSVYPFLCPSNCPSLYFVFRFDHLFDICFHR